MNIQMVDLRAQVAALRDDLDAAIAEVLSSGAFVRGPFVQRFEEQLGAYYGGAHVLGVGNGTDALQLAYMAAGIGPGDDVIMPAFTFFATAEAAALLGATPVFVDIDPRTFNLDPTLIEAAITPRTRAIVPVHLFGQSADMDLILEIAERHDLAVIEDAAQAVGARYKGRRVGLMGDAGCLSFYPSKNLGAYGDGGACLSTNLAMDGTLRRLANHGSERKYHNTHIGINSRLDALQAAILSVKLPHLDAWTAARQDTADRYDAHFADLDWVTQPYRAPYADHVFHQYTLRVPADARDALAAHLRAQGIPTMVYYPVPLHRLPVFEPLNMAEGSLPETERAAREVLSLPMHPELTADQIGFIAETIAVFAETYTPVAA
ncbi:MAG: DegT/DnrJ/EryC1/StrS family aminotransferase [Rhodothermaceae bacterium]|nr:DegT/DnrJ/EryC1/StrS family aminotransferase [Rhodothermaceae bacterium]